MQNSILQWFALRFLDRPLGPRELLRARKVVYIVLIVVLFTASYFWRQNVEAQAASLAVQEEARGDVELSGSLIRLSLTGSRGLATCVLWMTAMEKQKKNQWNELEFYVRSLTKLQPHFITPWLFQSWNLSYNVSVDCDRIFDKYFYVTRGIQLLAEGERQNHDQPELRYFMGFYLDHKICQSDETNTLRSLFQLSILPPSRRDPGRFYTLKQDGSREFNWSEFALFCRENPKLVRRLRKGLFKEDERDMRRQFTCERPAEVVQFLSENWRVPSLYVETEKTPASVQWAGGQDRLKPLEERFPLLPPPPYSPARPLPPPQHLYQPAYDFQELTSDSHLDDDVDAWAVARAWFGYAQEPIPDPHKDWPGLPPEITDRVHQRKPAHMTLQIFRSYPALTQTHLAQSLQQEGWFDADEGWDIPDWFERFGNRFPDGSPARLTVKEDQTSLKAWRDCFRMWEKLGLTTKLLFTDPTEEVNTVRKADQYWDRKGLPRDSKPPDLPGGLESLPEDERELYRCARYMWEYRSYRQVSNFPHHYYRAGVEQEKDTVKARKRFYQAENWRLLASPDRALAIYRSPEALEAWLEKVLAWRDYDRHRQYREDSFIQEQTFETQLNYMTLLREQHGVAVKQRLLEISTAAAGLVNWMPGGYCPVPAGLAEAWRQYANPLPKVEVFREPFAVPVLDEGHLPEFAILLAGTVGSPTLPNPLMAVPTVAAGNRPLIHENIARQVLDRRKQSPGAAPAQPPKTEKTEPKK